MDKLSKSLLVNIFIVAGLNCNKSLQLVCKQFHSILSNNQRIFQMWCVYKFPEYFDESMDLTHLPDGCDWKWLAECLITKINIRTTGFTGKGYYDLPTYFYAGEWINSSYNGNGIYISNIDKHRNIGIFKNSKLHGFGKITWGDESYVGCMVNGKRHGYGKYIWKNPENMFFGYWKDNQQHGYGTHYWSSGSSYKGFFRNNNIHGQGIFTWSNGDIYSGGWIDGIPTDSDQYTHPKIRQALDKKICTRSVPGIRCNLGQLFHVCNTCNIRFCVSCKTKCHDFHDTVIVWSSLNNCGCTCKY